MKNMKVSWDDYSQYMEKLWKIKNVPTHQPDKHVPYETLHQIPPILCTRRRQESRSGSYDPPRLPGSRQLVVTWCDCSMGKTKKKPFLGCLTNRKCYVNGNFNNDLTIRDALGYSDVLKNVIWISWLWELKGFSLHIIYHLLHIIYHIHIMILWGFHENWLGISSRMGILLDARSMVHCCNSAGPWWGL